MDVEQLVGLVHDHKCLWDPNHSTYHLRDHQRLAWKDISEKLNNVTVEELKKKWRGLRDSFARELKRIFKKKSVKKANLESYSKWPYFKQMLFLQETISRKQPQHISDEDIESLEEASDNTSVTSHSYEQDSDENYESIPKKAFTPLRKSKRPKLDDASLDETNTKAFNIEETQTRYVQDSVNYADAQFLMSLLPFLRDVPKHRKLAVRSKLQQVFMDEENEANANGDIFVLQDVKCAE